MPSSTLEQAIQYWLLNISGMSTYTSRVYLISAPDGATMPYITYHLTGGDNAGAVVGTTREPMASVQIDLWGSDQYELLTISNLIIADGEGKSVTVDGKPFLWVTTRGPIQMRDPDFENLYHFVIDAEISFNR